MVRVLFATFLLVVAAGLAIYCPAGQYFDGQHC